jgi:methyl-accepting chemotaxis protein
MNLERIPFHTKLYAGVIGLITVCLVGVSFFAIQAATKNAYDLGKQALKNAGDTRDAALHMHHETIQSKLQGDVAAFLAQTAALGKPRLAAEPSQKVTMVNQITQEAKEVEIPLLSIGVSDFPFGDMSLVERMAKIAPGAAFTLFQVVDGKLLRIATTVQKADGSRAIGTYIPADSPVTQAILRGETYTGRAFVVKEWFTTAYTPLQDHTGKIIGAVSAGRPILTPEVRSFISGLRVADVGYFFAYDSSGKFWVHPKLEGKNLFELPVVGDIFKANTDRKVEGFVEYPWEGETKYTYVRYIEPWDLYVAAGLKRSEILQGADKAIIRSALLAGGPCWWLAS